MTVAQWSDLSRIPCWTPLHAIRYKWSHLRDTLVRLDRNCYLIAVDHDEKLRRATSRFVTALLWAENEGAALRASLMDIEADNGDRDVNIPSEMLVDGIAKTFGTIIESLKVGSRGAYIEQAKYRIARDGAFIHRVVRNDIFEFYFRKRIEERDEVPYAILRQLKD